MATIKDVAAKAGVSVGTASRVLNKRGYISKETYAKVYQAIEELNYQPNIYTAHKHHRASSP